MPTYAYKCEACSHAADEWLKMSEASAERICPACGKTEYRKQVTAPAFQLKGGGWYVTDFRDTGKAKTAIDDPAKPVATPTADKPSEAKPAASSEAGGAPAPAPTTPSTAATE
jgi:putative FmdB family regulatory protein